MSILEEIRKQPQHIRETMFALSVITTLSLVGVVWYNSFQKDFYALLNPEEVLEEKNLAEKDPESLFSDIGKSFTDVKAMFSGMLNGGNEDIKPAESGNRQKDNDRVYLLPLSGGR